MPIERQAAAYLREGRIYLHPYSKTTNGFWVFSEPVVVGREDDAHLAAKVTEVLSHSTTGIAHPVSWKGISDPLRKKLRSFSDPTKCVGVYEKEGGALEFMPTKNAGRGGFVHLPAKTIWCSASDDMSDALRRAFRACE